MEIESKQEQVGLLLQNLNHISAAKSLYIFAYSCVKKSAINSACFKTVSIAFACLSGG